MRTSGRRSDDAKNKVHVNVHAKCKAGFRIAIAVLVAHQGESGAVPVGDRVWVATLTGPSHTNHAPMKLSRATKPVRMLDEKEVRVAADIVGAFGGTGTAKNVFFFRTGEVLSTSAASRLKHLRQGSPFNAYLSFSLSVPVPPYFFLSVSLPISF